MQCIPIAPSCRCKLVLKFKPKYQDLHPHILYHFHIYVGTLPVDVWHGVHIHLKIHAHTFITNINHPWTVYTCIYISKYISKYVYKCVQIHK